MNFKKNVCVQDSIANEKYDMSNWLFRLAKCKRMNKNKRRIKKKFHRSIFVPRL